MKAALVQYSQYFEDINRNIDKLNSMLNGSITDEDIIIFPEMTLTGYTMEAEKFSGEVSRVSIQYFSRLSVDYGKHVLAGIIEKYENGLYNTLVHFNREGKIAARYRKVHLFSYSKEDRYYSSSSEPVVSIIDGITAGLSICYDLRFPELYRFYGKERAGIIVNIASWPVKRIEHWKILLRARAIENQCYVIGVNRTGDDPFNSYNGNSGIFDPLGNEIALAHDKEMIISCDMDLSTVEDVRKRFRFLDDMKLI